jgi:hypothetical protein
MMTTTETGFGDVRATPPAARSANERRAHDLAKRAPYEWHLYPASEFRAHAKAWQGLRKCTSRPPVLDAIFIETLLEHFGHGDEVLAICGATHAPHAMAILRQRRPGVWETFQASQGPLSPWIFDSHTSYEKVLPSLMRALPGLPLIVAVTQKDPAIHPRPATNGRLIVLDHFRTGRIFVDRSHEEYWQSRHKKIRYEMGRRLRRLSELGIEPALDVIRDRADVAAAIDTYADIESRGWKAAIGTAVRGDDRQRRFYDDLLQKLAAAGAARIYRYRFGDRVVAMQLCVESDDTLVFLKTTYLEEYGRYSPGLLMKRAILEDIFRRATIKRIEFYGPLLPWQEHWVDDVRTLYHVNYYRWPWLARMHSAHGAVRLKVKRVEN